VSDWRPDRSDEEIQAEMERLLPTVEQTVLDGVRKYLGSLFTADFMMAYTFFASWDDMFLAARNERDELRRSGAVEGRRHTAHILHIRQLEREGDTEEAERLLLECCAIEERIETRPLMSYFHERLAMLYEKQKRFAEAVSICERFLARVDPTGGEMHERMGQRLKRVRRRLARQL
jgi:tetratricopeptide (TPR) repeat protein